MVLVLLAHFPLSQYRAIALIQNWVTTLLLELLSLQTEVKEMSQFLVVISILIEMAV